MRILLTGGGTGGHIYPALTIADEIRLQEPAVQFTYAGTAGGLEADLVPRAGLPFVAVQAGALIGKGLAARLRSAAALAAGTVQCFRLLGRLRPDAVLATGGFVSGPVLLAARLRRVRYCIWEGNAFPGSTVRLFSRGAAAVFIPLPEAGRHFPAGAQLEVSGNPVRRAVADARRDEARAQLGLGADEQLLLVVGGSQGALGIHQAVAGAAPALAQRRGLRLLHVTGPRMLDHVAALYREAGLDPVGQPWLQLVPYQYDMPTALAAADLAVTRAGATTIAELAARGLPAIIVPFPHSTHNHQEHNARALEARGAAIVILQRDLTPGALAGAVAGLLDDPDRRAAMAAALRAAARPDAAARIAGRVLAVARSRRRPSRRAP